MSASMREAIPSLPSLPPLPSLSPLPSIPALPSIPPPGKISLTSLPHPPPLTLPTPASLLTFIRDFSLAAPLPLPLAHTRLKQNLFALVLLALVRRLFQPYRVIREVLVAALEYGLGTTGAWAPGIIGRLALFLRIPLGAAGEADGVLESAVGVVLLVNVVQAGWWVVFPAKKVEGRPSGQREMGGVRVSSPLTRSYPLDPRSTPSSSTALQSSSPTPIQRFPYSPQLQSTPSRASPLSASASKIFNPQDPGTPPSATGLFYDSPSKLAQGHEQAQGIQGQAHGQGQSQGGQQPSAGGTGGNEGGDFVLIDREEKEWTENVWRGVRGKGGKAGTRL